ncbi:hypothetical protein DAI22_11g203200 [Oryza sativa Japonica Group]|nr:hypothetical protein DAI22_11g203200 [Oryza sativa Japonica Group]
MCYHLFFHRATDSIVVVTASCLHLHQAADVRLEIKPGERLSCVGSLFHPFSWDCTFTLY